MTVAAAILSIVAPNFHHHRDPPPTMQTAVASWYAEHGPGACNIGDVQTGYRFASLILACGTRIRLCRAGRCVTATMSDHGPYITGRTFDLNQNVAGALDCWGVCPVRWRLA